jgi:hypothetical protein
VVEARTGSVGSIRPVAPLTFVSQAGSLVKRDECSLLTRPLKDLKIFSNDPEREETITDEVYTFAEALSRNLR